MSVRFAILVALILAVTLPTYAQLAFVTFLNNSPDPSLKTADLYVTQAGETTMIEDISFQNADNMNSIAIFGDLEVTFAIASGSSINAGEAYVQYSFTPATGRGYFGFVSGVKTPASYLTNPDGKSTALAINTFEVVETVVDPNKTGVLFIHGATDLEIGDIWFRGAVKATVPGISYSGYTTTATSTDRKVVTIDYTKKDDKTKLVASFSVDYASLASSVVVCVLSGFKSPGDNASSTDTLTLLSVLDDGRVVKSPLIAGSQTSRVQFIHNAADPALTIVDIWLNGVKAFENVSYRKAQAFTAVPANTPLVIGFAPATSTAYRDTLRTISIEPLRPGRTYSMVATGVLDSSKFRDNPNGLDIQLRLIVSDGALEQSPETNKSAVRVGHFSTDSKQISIASSSTTYATRMSYLDVSPEYTLVTPATDTLWVLDSAQNKIKGYVCDLRGVNKSFIILASGFDIPDSNMSGAGFKLILVEANGTVNSNLVEVNPGTVSVDNNADQTSQWVMGPNPARDEVRLSIPLPYAIGPFTAELVSVNGQPVITNALHSDGVHLSGSISLTTVPNGMYRVRVVASDGCSIGSMGLVVTR